jgi:hypothetical protein
MKRYTIKIISGNSKKNEMPFAAYCKEWGIVAENETIPETLSSLFAAIHILEEEERKTTKQKNIPTKEISFCVPLAA